MATLRTTDRRGLHTGGVRRPLLYVVGWLAAVVVATSVGIAAVSLVGHDVGAPVKGAAAVEASGTQVTGAGTVAARCTPAGAQLVSWSPKNGWSVRSVDQRGVSRQVVFADRSSQVAVLARCVGLAAPVFDVSDGALVTPEDSPGSP